MGVDYFHGIYSTETSKPGSLQTAQQIEDVLRSHGLVDEAVSRWCLDAGNVHQIETEAAWADVRNVGFSFSSMEANFAPAIAAGLLGDAGASPELDLAEAAWAEFYIVSGPDYRLMTEGESGPGVRVIEPPVVDGHALAAFSPAKPGAPKDRMPGWGHVSYGASAFDASTGCAAPVCELDWFAPIRNPHTGEVIEGPTGFDGLWRTALLIQTKPYGWLWTHGLGTFATIPDTQFKEDLWSVMGGSVFELGYVW